jgi:hypothetical protein
VVNLLGSVRDRLLEESDLRHFELQTSVWDNSTATSIQFSVVCFFENTKRWENTKTPSAGSYVSVTAKIVGRTTKENYLAVRILDLGYLPKTTSTTSTTPAQNPTATPTAKRSYRWGGRVDSASPSKKRRTSGIGTGSADGSPAHTAPRTPRTVDNNEVDQQLAIEITDHLNDTSPCSTPIDLED